VRRRRLPRRKAAEALARGQCMFALLDDCNGLPCPQSLDDDNLVLVCPRHVPRLLELRRDLAEVRRLRRYLGHAFERSAA
jgi:hypothetical protein